jgi:hypothetical protein
MPEVSDYLDSRIGKEDFVDERMRLITDSVSNKPTVNKQLYKNLFKRDFLVSEDSVNSRRPHHYSFPHDKARCCEITFSPLEEDTLYARLRLYCNDEGKSKRDQSQNSLDVMPTVVAGHTLAPADDPGADYYLDFEYFFLCTGNSVRLISAKIFRH